MTEYYLVLFTGLVYILSGEIMRAMAHGHWSEYTRPIENYKQRYALSFISYLMLFYGFYSFCALVMGPVWALFMASVIVGLFILKTVTFDNDDDDFDDDED